MNAIEHLEEKVWKTPESYGGFDPVGDYCVLSKHRDSELLDRVNWDIAVETLKAEPMDHGRCGDIPADRPNVYTWQASHWAVGWVEYMMVRADAPDDIKTAAGEMICSLAEYPMLDERRYSDAQFEAVGDYWAQCSVSDRVDYLRDAGLSIFAARRDYLPDNDSGSLYERLSTGI